MEKIYNFTGILTALGPRLNISKIYKKKIDIKNPKISRIFPIFP